jgi:Zn-dependent metalloprotease
MALTVCTIVPPHLLDRLARYDDPALYGPAGHTLELDEARRTHRRLTSIRGALVPGPADVAAGDARRRTIYDAAGGETLPGERVRGEGGKPTGDESVDRAYDGLGATYELYAAAYARQSVDGAGLPLDATVHYGEKYANAFWDGERMVFGDGDGQIFRDLTRSVDVIGHELTHGVTQYTANFEYFGQSGALNESVSDVFGSLIKQHTLGQTAGEADWLIGAGLFTDRVRGEALRSMKAPGSAYDDEMLGKDPQPATMADYVNTSVDNGGVHINSGIPNRAFYLAAVSLNGYAWERAGQIWYDTLTDGGLGKDAEFVDFARATVKAARARYGGGKEADAVLGAWGQVGVTGL